MRNFKFISIGILIGAILFSSVVVASEIMDSNFVTYTKNGSSKTVKETLDNLYKKVEKYCPKDKECLTNEQKISLENTYINSCPDGKICLSPISNETDIGNYIYLKPTSTSYTITTNMTGYSSNQTINPSELEIWRVIRKNEDGTIDIVSDRISSKTIYFKGQVGYQNYIGTLNSIAAQYASGNSNLIQSTRHTGYDGTATEYITDTTYLVKTTVPWTTGTSSSTTIDEEKLGKGDMGYLTDFNLIKSVYDNSPSAKTPDIKNSNGNVTTAGVVSSYWLASRRYDYGTTADGYKYWNFSGIAVDTNLFISSLNHFKTNATVYNPQVRNYAIRPILTIKANAKIVSGSGTESLPYQLGL